MLYRRRCVFPGVFDSTLDRSDRKISAPANLETPKIRTTLLGPGTDNRNALKVSSPIPENAVLTTTTASVVANENVINGNNYNKVSNNIHNNINNTSVTLESPVSAALLGSLISCLLNAEGLFT